MTIASALAKSARLLILDEPTAALTEAESEKLFAHLRLIKSQGVGCLYISHRLDEIQKIADRVVVMRNGRVVARLSSARGNRRRDRPRNDRARPRARHEAKRQARRAGAVYREIDDLRSASRHEAQG